MVPGKLGLVETKVKVLVGRTLALGLFDGRGVGNRRLPAADHEHVRGQGDADRRGESIQAIAVDREPASGIEQIAGVIADVCQFKARHRAVVAGFELSFIFESQGRGGALRQARGEWHPHRGILGYALGGERLVLFVCNLGDAQVIVQIEDWRRSDPAGQ